jgi:hypothetical protein
MFGFGKKKTFDDTRKDGFAEGLAGLLECQLVVVPGNSLNDAKGQINRKAIGYVYGYVDCALRCMGQDMSDVSVGVPILFQVFRRLFPGNEETYTSFLIEHIHDPVITLGMMTGGQQYVDFIKPGRKGVPMGLARFLLDGLR